MEEININFIYNSQEILIQCKRKEFIKDILKKFCLKIEKSIDDIYFLYNGEQVNEELKLDEINNDENQIKILVFDIEKNEDDKESIKHSKDIICPICGDNCLINVSDYRITLHKCPKNHKISNTY